MTISWFAAFMWENNSLIPYILDDLSIRYRTRVGSLEIFWVAIECVHIRSSKLFVYTKAHFTIRICHSLQ